MSERNIKQIYSWQEVGQAKSSEQDIDNE